MFVPIPIFPVFGGCALGLMRPLGYMAPVVAWLIYIQLLCFTGVAIYLALLYRLAAIYGHADLFERKSVIAACIAFQCAFGMPVLISGMVIYLPEEQSMAYMQMNYPNLIPFYQSHSCAVMMADSEMLMRYGYTILPTFLFATCLINLVVVFLARRLAKAKHTVSTKTYKMHKSLTISLCFQFALPMCMLICSEIIGAFAAVFQWKSAKTIFYACFLFSTMHTAANGVIMVAFVKPYREAFFALFSIYRQKRKMIHLIVGPDPITRTTIALPTARIAPKRTNLMRRPSSCPQ